MSNAAAVLESSPVDLVVICAWCPDFDRTDARNATASHGICPTCVSKFDAPVEQVIRDASGRVLASLAGNEPLEQMRPRVCGHGVLCEVCR